MSSKSLLPPRRLARLVPDEARWIDLRGLLLTERCDVWCDSSPERGFIATSRDFPFGVLYGCPDVELVMMATSEASRRHCGKGAPDGWQLLAAPEERDLVNRALPDWHRRTITMHRWVGSLRSPGSFEVVEVMLLRQGLENARVSLAELPEPSRRELELPWVARRPAAVATTGASLVSICWAAFTTESLWDVAIETVEPFRRRGLAAACFLTLAAEMAESGLLPSWGAAENNPASLRLAAKLGFVMDGRLDGWSPAPRGIGRS